jgi:hypothetical protein
MQSKHSCYVKIFVTNVVRIIHKIGIHTLSRLLNIHSVGYVSLVLNLLAMPRSFIQIWQETNHDFLRTNF